MKCELNVTAGLLAGHNAVAEWRVVNQYGAPFDLCDKCVTAYKKKNPDWEKRRITIVKLTMIEPPILTTGYRG